MIVIKTTDGGQYWTEKYNEADGFIKFDIITKQGKTMHYELNKTQIISIGDVGEVNTDKTAF